MAIEALTSGTTCKLLYNSLNLDRPHNFSDLMSGAKQHIELEETMRADGDIIEWRTLNVARVVEDKRLETSKLSQYENRGQKGSRPYRPRVDKQLTFGKPYYTSQPPKQSYTPLNGPRSKILMWVKWSGEHIIWPSKLQTNLVKRNPKKISWGDEVWTRGAYRAKRREKAEGRANSHDQRDNIGIILCITNTKEKGISPRRAHDP
ncbi:conserved hypothetical protein [Ricinus communis]|uniref:Uncharacterized protein n=1 Tax=Ricinus communis TaxID=3988 RepID=B9RHN4_RICCO|nr:conserved hypothetical protein [Ricinus communis]